MVKYLIDEFYMIVLVLGFIILLFNNLKIEQEQANKIIILLLATIAMTISNVLELYFASLDHFNYGRIICSFLCYSLRPFIGIQFIALLTNNKILKYFYGLTIINLLIYSTCFYSKIAFGYTEANSFVRGPLGYSTHVVSTINLILLIWLIIKKHNNQAKIRTVLLSFIALAGTSAAMIDNVLYTSLFDQTQLICVLIYYLFLHMEYNKIDVLTKTYNRYTFYNDIDMYKHKITAVLSIDMNNLKLINDTMGHLEGDKALTVLADVLLEVDKNKTRVYRVGGDEFVILCLDYSEEKVNTLIKKIKDNMKETKYTCSIGYEMSNNHKEMYDVYKVADEKMYKEKDIFHANQRKNKEA